MKFGLGDEIVRAAWRYALRQHSYADTEPEFHPLPLDSLPQGVRKDHFLFRCGECGWWLWMPRERPPVTWQLTSGTLPEGLTLDVLGGLAGVPNRVGAYPISIWENADGSIRVQEGHWDDPQA